MSRRFGALAAAIAAAFVVTCTSAEQVDARSTITATAVHHCSVVAATSHRSKGPRALSAVKLSKAQHLCAKAHPLITTIKFWVKPARSWTLYQRYQRFTCWELRRKNLLQGPEALCSIARGAVRTSTQKLVKLDVKIKELLPRPVIENLNLPYRHFNSCLGAVNYLFHGRWDLSRARMVVHRESTDNPKVDNGTHFGCAQESTKMMSDHLRGPWNDAYYNVWVLLWEAEHNGWCNWDIVNYCAPGGEF